MSATAILTTTARPRPRSSRTAKVRRTGAVVGVAASAATAGIAAAADGLGVPIQIAGKTIPLLGFAQ